MANKIMYSYMVDSGRSDRVVTIARELREDGKKVAFGFAVCMPDTYYEHSFREKNGVTATVTRKNGDVFTKAKGRMIAEGRLNKHPQVIDVPENQHPMDAIRMWLADDANQKVNELDKPRFMARIVSADLVRMLLKHRPGKAA